MTVLRLARSELKRMTGGLLPKLTILALTMVPLLYGAVYLYANWDPYGNLDQIDAALVVEDTGATSADGTELQAGPEGGGQPDRWARLQLAAGLQRRRGRRRVSAAASMPSRCKIPKDFSANLVSPGSFDAANQAMLNVTTNDANNYLLSTIVDKLTTAVHSTRRQGGGRGNRQPAPHRLRHHPRPDGQSRRRRRRARHGVPNSATAP